MEEIFELFGMIIQMCVSFLMLIAVIAGAYLFQKKLPAVQNRVLQTRGELSKPHADVINDRQIVHHRAPKTGEVLLNGELYKLSDLADK